MGDHVILKGGTEVYIQRDPLGFLGDRIKLSHKDAPPDLSPVEVGKVVEDSGKNYLQLPESEFGIGPEVLRTIAELLEGDDDA